MMPKTGQLYFKTGVDKRIQKNWIISKLTASISKNKNISASKSVVVPGKETFDKNINPKLEEKLEHLKYLHNKQLLNEEEYKNQQKKILDELF